MRDDGQKPHSQGRGSRGKLAHDSKAHRFDAYGKCGVCALTVRVLTWGDLRRERCDWMTTLPGLVHTGLPRPSAVASCPLRVDAQVVILDAAVTAHTAHDLWVSTGIRAIDHAVETVCSRGPQPFTDATCLQGLKMLSAPDSGMVYFGIEGILFYLTAYAMMTLGAFGAGLIRSRHPRGAQA